VLLQEIEEAVIAQCEVDAANAGGTCPFSDENPPDIDIDCGGSGGDSDRRSRQSMNMHSGLHAGFLERLRRGLSFLVVIQLPGVPESSFDNLAANSVVVAGFTNIITTTTTVSTTTTTTTATNTTTTASTTTNTTVTTRTTTTVNCDECSTSPNLHAFLVMGLGGEFVDRSLAAKSQFGEDDSAYSPIFANIHSTSEATLEDAVQVPWMLSQNVMVQNSTLLAFQQLCLVISADAHLVLAGQYQLCEMNKVANVMYGVRPAFGCISGVVDVPDVVMWMAVEFVTTQTKGAQSQNLVDAHKAFSVHIAAAKLDHVIMVSSQFEMSYNETLAISGAIWGIIISLGLTLVIVYLFKGSFRLTLLTLAIIIGNLGIIVAMFGWMGWTLGGVEAIALSIIVGTSVDYCLHMMEGYAESANRLQLDLHATSDGRDVCAHEAMVCIGVPIISSAITTAGAAVFLSTCNLQILSKFGQILVINVSIAIFLSLTALPASFAWVAPTKIGSWFKRALVPLVIGSIVGAVLLCIWILQSADIYVKNANGENLL